jgi:hypothetical protein
MAPLRRTGIATVRALFSATIQAIQPTPLGHKASDKTVCLFFEPRVKPDWLNFYGA